MIGAGPAGNHAAYVLAQAGLEVVLLEAQSRIGDRAICSGVVGDEAFARFDLPRQPIISDIRAIQAVSATGKKLEYCTEAPLAQVIDKAAFNRALAERAFHAGAWLQLGAWVNTVQVEKHSVTVQYRAAAGAQSVKAQVAIITTGVNGALNQRLGLARSRQFLRAVQAEMALPPNGHGNDTRVFVGRDVAPGAFGWEIPRQQPLAGGADDHRGQPVPLLCPALRRIAPNTDLSGLHINRKGIAQAADGPCVADRVVAAGEAAGHIKTTTGGGIYYGLLSAELAAEAVIRAFRSKDFSARRLSEFERQWRSAFGRELMVGYFARRIASHFTDATIDRFLTRPKRQISWPGWTANSSSTGTIGRCSSPFVP